MQRAEAPKAARSQPGTHYTVGPRRKLDQVTSRWTVEGRSATAGGEAVTEARFDCLHWDDLVRAMWPRPGWSFVRDTAWSISRAALAGYFNRIYRVRNWYVLTIFQPVVALLGILLGLAALGAGVVAAVAALASLSLWWAVPGAALGLLALPLVLRRVEKVSTVLWRGQINNFYATQIFDGLPLVDARIDAFAQAIVAAAAEGEAEELIVVSHSIASTVAVSSLARALERGGEALARVPHVGLVTLGGTTPLLAAEPRCGWFRDEVARIALDPHVTWVDIATPADVVCFSKVDPLLLAGRTRPAGARVSPVLLSPGFHKLFPAERYAALKRDKLQLHNQYLKATDTAGRCDFFGIIAGPLALAERFPDTSADKRR